MFFQTVAHIRLHHKRGSFIILAELNPLRHVNPQRKGNVNLYAILNPDYSLIRVTVYYMQVLKHFRFLFGFYGPHECCENIKCSSVRYFVREIEFTYDCRLLYNIELYFQY